MYLQGDGKHTFGQLIQKHPRAKYYEKKLKKEFIEQWQEKLPSDKIIQLNYIGNHCR